MPALTVTSSAPSPDVSETGTDAVAFQEVFEGIGVFDEANPCPFVLLKPDDASLKPLDDCDAAERSELLFSLL